MSVPVARVRTIDRARAFRAVLAFRQSDALGLEHVAREAAGDADPESVAQLVVALTETAANFLSSIPDGDAKLQQILLDHAKHTAEQEN